MTRKTNPSPSLAMTAVALVLLVGFAVALATAQPEPGSEAAGERLSQEEIDRVVKYIVGRIQENGGVDFSGEDIAVATGVAVKDSDTGLLRAEVLLKLEEIGAVPDLATSRCEQYSACSIYGNLSFATDDVLATYERERSYDGSRFDLPLVAFEARNLADEVLRPSDVLGQPSLLVFLAVHCQHSLDTIPVLNDLVARFAPSGLQVVGVYINSGSVEDLNDWLPEQDPHFEVWAHEDPAFGDLVDNHLVPVFFFLDPDGRITEKAVGQKDSFEMRRLINQFLDRVEAAG